MFCSPGGWEKTELPVPRKKVTKVKEEGLLRRSGKDLRQQQRKELAKKIG